MDIAEVKQKLHDYIDAANEEKLQSMYASLEEDTQEYNWWEDEEFLDELDRREQAYLNGTEKGYTFEESINRLKALLDK